MDQPTTTDNKKNRQAIVTDNFKLYMQFDPQTNALFIEIQDFIDGKLYQKQYGRDKDFAIKIHNQQTFFQIFVDLCQLLREIYKGKQVKLSLGEAFTFGNCSLTILKEGKIQFIQKTNTGRKDIDITQILQLDFISPLQNKELIFQKILKIQSFIKNLKTEKQQQQQKISELQSHQKELVKTITNLQKKIVNFSKKMQVMEGLLSKKDSEENKKYDGINSTFNKFTNNVQKCQQTHNVKNEQSQSINISKQAKKQQQQEKAKARIDILNKVLEEYMFNPVDHQSKNYQHFSIKDCQITMNIRNYEYYQLLMHPIIAHFHSFSFSFKIVKTNLSKILIGITNRKSSLNHKNSYKNQQNIVYQGYVNGCSKNHQNGSGFKTGDTVKTIVNFENFTVNFYVNEVLQMGIYSQKLGQHQLQFVPYIQMFSQGDCVQWLGCKYILLQKN